MDNSEGESEKDVSPRRNRSTGSRGTKTPSPKKMFTPQYAICVKAHTPTTKDQLRLEAGDVLVGIRKLFGDEFNIWEGENKRTGQLGTFNADTVEFFEGSPSERPNVPDSTTPLEPDQSNQCVIVGVVIAVIAAVLLSQTAGLGIWKRSRNPVNLTELEGTFKSQDPSTWTTLQAGLLPSKTEKVKTFLFVHAKDNPTTECLIKKISDNFCTVYKADKIRSTEDFVSEMRNSLQQIKCMVIYDLENLSAEGIAVLKGFCDAYTPIVSNAEFYFALDTGEPPVGTDVRNVAYQKLENLWSSKYSHDEFGGTITRLTQNVLRVIGEEKVPC